MKTKLFTLFLALVASAGTVLADSYHVGGGFWVTIDNVYYTAEIVIGKGGNVVIPASVDFSGHTYKVTSIGESAFSGFLVTSVTIPNSVTSIGEKAFYGCTGLTSVNIPNSITSIGKNAFSECTSLTTIEIPYSVTSIGEKAFYGCTGLTSVTILNSVIGEYAFYGCTGLSSVTIGSNVKSIELYAFAECTGLTSVTIPNSVTRIGHYAFSGCSGLTSIEIPNSVTSIGGGAFSGCTGLTSVTIPNSVTSIGDYAFSGCSGLTSIEIPNSVTSIGGYAFSGCTGLTSIEISNSVKSIGDGAFSDCTGLTSANINARSIGNYAFSGCTDLTSVTISNSVTDIANNAFSGCISLTSIKVAADNAKYCDLDGVLFNKDKTKLIQCPEGKKGEYIIPNGVLYIGNSAFAGCSGITSVTIGENVTSIGNSVFSGCNSLEKITWNAINCSTSEVFYGEYYDIRAQIKSITFGDKVTYISSSLCKGMSNLTSVIIGESVTNIGESAFSGCTGLTSIEIPNSVTSIGESAFSGCTGLTSIEIPNSVTSIGSSAFQNCSGLTSVTIPNSVTSIGLKAFYNCTSLTSVTIPNSVTSIGESAFSVCTGLTSVTIPNSVTSIGKRAFSGCSGLTSVTIPNSVTSIGNYAFHSCTALTSITIPNIVTSIGEGAFYGCTGLTSVTIGDSVTSIGENAFYGCTGLKSVTLLSDAIVSKAYSSNLNMGTIFGKQVEEYIIGEDVTSIGEAAFSGCSNLTSVTLLSNAIVSKAYSSNSNIGTIIGTQVKKYILGDNVTRIGKYAFYNCKSMTSVTIGSSVKSIEYNAFYGCKNLTSIEISNSVTSIGGGAFSGCTGLTSVTIGSNVKSIGSSAFSGCTGLNSVTIPSSVSAIGKGAFTGCTGLTLVRIYDIAAWCSVTFGSSESNPLSYARNLYLNEELVTNLFIPNSVTSIGNRAFFNCTGFTSIEIPNSVTSIGDSAFFNCTGLTSVTCRAVTPPSLGARVFGNYSFLGFTSGIPLYVFKESASKYKNAAQWKIFNVKLLDPDIYTITATAQNGIVEGAGTFWEDTTIQLLAIPKEGYVFQKWSDGITINPRPIRVIENAVYEAEFVKAVIPAESVNLPYNESFSSSIGKFSIKNVNLGGINYVWALTSNYGMKASAYVNQSYATESWLVSPLISLYNTTDIVLSFDHAVNKGTTANLRVKISTDLGTSWSDLTVPKWPAGTNWDFVSTSLSLDAYANKVVQIAFIYKSTTSNCPTWEIKNFSIKGTVISGRPLPIDVEPAETSASVTWLTISNANSYELIIRDMNGNAICSIIFDAEGHVQSVTNYAPSRDNASQLEQANDFAYTVTGLTDDTDYNFILIGKDNEDKVITTYSGSFRTKSSSQGIEETPLDFDKPVKIIHDGQIFILRGEHVYDAQGKMVK